MEQNDQPDNTTENDSAQAQTVNIDELLAGANLPSWQAFEEKPRETANHNFALDNEWPAVPPTHNEKPLPQLDSPTPGVEDFVERLSTVSWTGFAAKPRETRPYPSAEELPPGPYAPSPEPEETTEDDAPETRDPSIVLPVWVYDITPERLPKRPGYLIYRDNEGYACIATCSNWWRQTYAAIVDNYLTMVGTLYLAAAILVICLVNRSYSFVVSNWWAISGIWVALYFTYNFSAVAFGGQTFGKERLNLRVARGDGRRPTVVAAFIRSFYTAFLIYWCALFFLIPNLLWVGVVFILLLGYFTTFFDPYRRTLPDILAGTYSINTDDLMVEGSAF